MDGKQASPENLDRSISSNLLLIALTACRAGLFYTPITKASDNVLQFVHSNSEQSWSLNISTLYGLAEPPKTPADLLPYIEESDRHLITECVKQAATEEQRENECEYRIHRPDGSTRWLMSRILIGRDEQGEKRYLLSMCFDITEQKQQQEHLTQANKQLKQAQTYLQTALSASGIAIFRHAFDTDNASADTGNASAHRDVESWNFNLAHVFGYPTNTAMTPELLLRRMRKEDIDEANEKAREALLTHQSEYQHEYPIQWDDQSSHWLLSKCTIDFDEKCRPQFMSGAIIDITHRKQAEEKMQYIATHDVLTALPNRFMFNNLLAHTIETANRYSLKFALFFIDLDRFKAINDALGHQAGDQLLVDTAHRLRKCLRTSDVLARISGDEFVVLAPELDSEEGAGSIARKILAEVNQPMVLLGHRCQVSASIGICLFPEHGDNEQALIKNADSAMYVAKEAGKNNYQFFNAASTSQSLERMSIENELRSALENNELSLQYQAKLDLHNNRITGVEALLRWDNAKFGSVSPAKMIPMAEESGLIVPIGRWVLMTACKQNVAWQAQGLPAICVAVNISARQFLSKDLLSHIKEALEESGMEPQLLEIEITESMVMHNVDQAIALLHEIKKLGVRIAIDDFGTGYSSLAQLKRFPIDTLKVDRSFITEVANNAGDQAITDAVIALGKSLSLTIIAEGVETQEQQDYLRKRACDEMQGYHFSRPVEPEEFSRLLGGHIGSE